MADKDSSLRLIKQRYNIVGNCDELNRALELAQKVARAELSVLVLGENGSGKEVMSRIIHDNSGRKDKKFLAVNCGAIPEGTIDSELFGHVEGAFTGSVGNREGFFAVANKGTLFLDEVGELPLQTQARLLRVLENGEYIPVGSSEPLKTDVRIVAATNVDLKRAVQEGRFREDLYYRLSAVIISVPPLRSRGKDIDMLFRKFALDNQEKYGNPPVRLNDEARNMLMRYPWPGNVRQLRNVVEAMSILCEEREITPEGLAQFIPADEQHTQLVSVNTNSMDAWGQEMELDDMKTLLGTIKKLAFEVAKLKQDVEELKEKAFHQPSDYQDGATKPLLVSHKSMNPHAYESINEDDYTEIESETPVSASAATKLEEQDNTQPQSMEEMERKQIRDALVRNAGNRRKTATELKISERTLYRKIKEYGLKDLVKKAVQTPPRS